MKKKRKTPSLLLVSAIIFILIGIVALIYPIIGNYLANQQRSSAVLKYDTALNELSKVQIDRQKQLAEKYNKNIYAQQAGKIDPYPAINYESAINVEGVMATLDIPAISISKMPIYHGTNELVLNEGLGHFKPSSIPIGGKDTRSVISGHSGLRNQILFTNIEKLKLNDIFYINILGERLAYKIESIDEVLPTQIEKVNILPGKDMVTLLTCTPPGINTYRLLVNGIRIPYNKAVKNSVTNRNEFSYSSLVILSLSICLTLFLFLLSVYFILKKKKKNSKTNKQKEIIVKYFKIFFISIKTIFISILIFILVFLSFVYYGYHILQAQVSIEPISIGENTELFNYNLDKISNGNYTQSDISSVNLKSYGQTKINFNDIINQNIIGKLAIPKLAIDLPILAGMNNDNLLSGVATYSETQKFGENNFPLLSHNIADQKGEPIDVLLGRINELNKDDEIYISDFQSIYCYKLIENKVIKDTDMEYFEQTLENKATITLMRCEGGVGTTYRRVAKGELVKTETINSSNGKNLNLLGLERKKKLTDNKILINPIYSNITVYAIELAINVLMNPLQAAIPIILLLITPILFINLIPSQKNKK